MSSLADRMAKMRQGEGGSDSSKNNDELISLPQELVDQAVDRAEMALPTDFYQKQDEEKGQFLEKELDSLLAELNVSSTAQFQALKQRVLDEFLGLGPLQCLMDDRSTTEIMVNGPKKVYIERAGKLHLSDIKFRDEKHVRQVVDRIMAPLGRVCDETQPYQDARTKNGSRVNVVIYPIALDGSMITIRKFSKDKLGVQDLIRFGSINQKMADFLEACVEGHLNIVISGGTGSGKTTLLNVMSSFIPPGDRILTIEDSAELQLKQDHVGRLETRPPDREGKGAVSIRDMIKNALRMRPDRIVVGECRGAEALDMLQAMNTGHDGSLTTLHANTPRDAITRIETMVMMAGFELPIPAIRAQIASAIHVIVQQSRIQDGSRKLTYITEIQGMEGDQVVLQDIFVFEQKGVDEKGKVEGELKPTGMVPLFLEKLQMRGIKLPNDIFTR